MNIGKALQLTVTPTTFQSTRSVKKIAIEERNCLFSTEKKTEIQIPYSFQTCMTDCRINAIYRICGCIPYFYYNIRKCFQNAFLVYLRRAYYFITLINTNFRNINNKMCIRF